MSEAEGPQRRGSYRRWSDQEIGEALAVLDACEGNVFEASRITGVPRLTLSDWRNGARSNNLVTGFRQGYQVEIGKRAQELLEACMEQAPQKIESASLRDLAFAAERYHRISRLERDAPTGIHKHLSDPDALRVRIVEALTRLDLPPVVLELIEERLLAQAQASQAQEITPVLPGPEDAEEPRSARQEYEISQVDT